MSLNTLNLLSFKIEDSDGKELTYILLLFDFNNQKSKIPIISSMFKMIHLLNIIL